MKIEPKIITTEEGWSVIEGDSHLSRWIVENKRLDHDDHLIPLACSHLQRGDYVIDCGANLGSHSYAYSKAIGDIGMLTSIEAGALTAQALKQNVELFKHKNTYVLQACVSDVCGQSVSHSMIENAGASRCNLVKDDDRVIGEKYLLTVNLDYIREQMLVGKKDKKRIAFLKLDVEGFEVKCLTGAMNTLRIDRPKMLIEVNPAALEAQGDSVKDLFAFLTYYNYSYTICQPECTLESPQFDILATPNDLPPPNEN